MDHFYYYDTLLGRIGIGEREGKVTNVFFQSPTSCQDATEQETPLLKKTSEQITEYLLGQRTQFHLPIQMEGTEFQKKVWLALLEIPYGQTCSYGEIAMKIGNPKGARAVGMANHKNPLMLLVPCHRVIGTNGQLTGYASGLEKKEFLLKLEQRKNR